MLNFFLDAIFLEHTPIWASMNTFFLPRRFQPKLVLTIIGVLLFLLILSKLFGNSIDDDEEWYKHPEAYFTEVSCKWDKYNMDLFDELAKRMSQVLEKLHITYFLCYGSLWGALKFQQMLPWDRNIDMCVIYHQIATIDEQTLHSAFKQAELNYYYNSRRGKYVVQYKGVTGEITIFEKVGAHVERVGWEKRLLPHLYLNYQNFPYQLIDNEMTRVTFGSLKLPAPHEYYELQKYLYPENWWKEVKPKGCTEY